MTTAIASIAPTPPRPAGSETRDYERIARAIEYLRREAPAQPDLAAVARHVHMSEYHFQRLFTRWAGVSPKRFLQYLTLEAAKGRLVRTGSLANVADDVGLSGTGRLHDLFAILEAVSPADFRSGGNGLAIRYGIHASPFGAVSIATTERGVCGVHFVERSGEEMEGLRRQWPAARFIRDASGTAELAGRLFDPLARCGDQPLALVVKGTNFQLQVWRALLAVPLGRVTTYSELAKRIGHPDSPRAVGNAVGANPIAWLIPCHRVIRERGAFGNYRWGERRKAAMLGWEAARCESLPEDKRTLSARSP